jgi:hemin uptake protein HemP
VSKIGAPDRPEQRPPPGTATGQAPVTIDAARLFDGRDEIRLLHRGQEYRLRVTKQGKLILTK